MTVSAHHVCRVVSLGPPIYIIVHIPTHTPINPSIHYPSIYSSIYCPFIYPPILFIHPSIHTHTHLSIHSFTIHIFIYPYIYIRRGISEPYSLESQSLRASKPHSLRANWAYRWANELMSTYEPVQEHSFGCISEDAYLSDRRVTHNEGSSRHIRLERPWRIRVLR
jgi:hypothetical protein